MGIDESTTSSSDTKRKNAVLFELTTLFILAVSVMQLGMLTTSAILDGFPPNSPHSRGGVLTQHLQNVSQSGGLLFVALQLSSRKGELIYEFDSEQRRPASDRGDQHLWIRFNAAACDGECSAKLSSDVM